MDASANRAPITTLPPTSKGSIFSSTSLSSISVRQNHLYALITYQDSVEYPDVVTDMLRLFSHYVYCFHNLGSTLYCMTPYVTVHLKCCPESLSVPFLISTMVGHPVNISRFYRGRMISIGCRDTLLDLKI